MKLIKKCNSIDTFKIKGAEYKALHNETIKQYISIYYINLNMKPYKKNITRWFIFDKYKIKEKTSILSLLKKYFKI